MSMEQARALADAGFHVLAFDFRGVGESRGPGQADILGAPLHVDVLAAVRYLKAHDAKTAVVGGSPGGGAAGDASSQESAARLTTSCFWGALRTVRPINCSVGHCLLSLVTTRIPPDRACPASVSIWTNMCCRCPPAPLIA